MYLNLDLLYNIADYIFETLAICLGSIVYLWTECKDQNACIYWNVTKFGKNIYFKTDYNFKIKRIQDSDESFEKFGLQL